MKVIKSNLLQVVYDLETYLHQPINQTVFGYIIGDRVAVWDPVWFIPGKEELLDERYNMDFVDKNLILKRSVPVRGGTIVSALGDIGILIVDNDLFNMWCKPAMEFLKQYLAEHYSLNCEIDGNDMCIGKKKFLGTASGFYKDKHIHAMFISIYEYTDYLIRKICKKEPSHEGFVGLNKYKVCAKSLVTAMMNFTKRWEERKL